MSRTQSIHSRSPLRLRGSAAALLALLAAVLAVGSPARSHAQDLPSAQAALARYDLSDPRTYDALETLRRIADANGPEAPTARATRAYAAVDLLVASTVLEDQAAFARLGAALGAQDRATMGTLLERQLALTPSGALAVAAQEARSTLAGLLGGAGRRTVRSDAILLVTAPADEAALRARLRERFDPVTDGDLGVEGPQADEVRRIAAAVRAIVAAQRAAAQGDPLLALLGARLEAARERLTRLVVETPGLEGVDVFVRLSRGSLAVGFVTRAAVDGEGRITLVGGAPRWPETTAIALPAELPALVRPIEGLAQHALATSGAAGRRVALQLEGELPAHLVARIVRSLEGTALAITHLDTSEGRVAVTWIREDAADARALRIAIRPGGYALEAGRGRRSEIPRIRVEGRFHFDREALGRQLAASSTPRVISAFGLAPAAELIATAWLARTDGRATIILP